jgi:hypothetical protein
MPVTYRSRPNKPMRISVKTNNGPSKRTTTYGGGKATKNTTRCKDQNGNSHINTYYTNK